MHLPGFQIELYIRYVKQSPPFYSFPSEKLHVPYASRCKQARYLVIRFFAWKIWITKRSFTAGKHFEVARIVTKFFLFFFYFGLLSDYVSAFSHNSSYGRDVIPFYRKVWWIYARLFVPWKLEHWRKINRLPLSFYNSFNGDANASGHSPQKLFSHQRLCRGSKLSYHVVT